MTDAHISVSQLNMWLRCPKQYEFRYLDGLILAPKGAMARGKACHAAWEADHRHKMVAKENLPLEAVLDAYSDSFEQAMTEVDLGKDEVKGDIKDQGVILTQVYHEKVSTRVQPVAVEEFFEIEVAGHAVQGYIDLETDLGQIRDAKTAAKRKSEIPMDHQLQMAMYSLAKPEAKTFVLDTAVATSKAADVETLTLVRDELPLRRLGSYLDAFGESLLRGHFPPTNPGNWQCSQKWCGYWNHCKHGGGK